MDPRLWRTLFVLPGLATCPVSHSQPTLHALVAPVAPAREWPEPSELPEPEHPAHGEGSGDFPTLVGIGASGIYTNVAAQHIWFRSDPVSISPTQFFDEQSLKTLPKLVVRVQPQGKSSFRRTAMRRTVGSRSGRSSRRPRHG